MNVGYNLNYSVILKAVQVRLITSTEAAVAESSLEVIQAFILEARRDWRGLLAANWRTRLTREL